MAISVLTVAAILSVSLQSVAAPAHPSFIAASSSHSVPPAAGGIERLKMSNNLSATDHTADHPPNTVTDGQTSDSDWSPVWVLLIFAVGWIASTWWRKWYKRNALDQSDSAGVDTAQFPLGVPGYGQLGNPADDI
ncbi:MAG: hypothetical protein HKN70_07635, partial [Gammaproteobacteria bacterium]|nr:hypothetical protein [Gammaproteobacteria bacterium]